MNTKHILILLLVLGTAALAQTDTTQIDLLDPGLPQLDTNQAKLTPEERQELQIKLERRREARREFLENLKNMSPEQKAEMRSAILEKRNQEFRFDERIPKLDRETKRELRQDARAEQRNEKRSERREGASVK